MTVITLVTAITFPTTLRQPMSVAKKLAKEMDKHATLYAQLQEKPGGPEAFVAGLRDEIEALRS